MPSAEGNLDWKPLADHPELVAHPVAQASHRVPDARVAEIDEALADTAAFAAFHRHMLERGVYLAPSQFESAMISLALTEDDLARAAEAAAAYFAG